MPADNVKIVKELSLLYELSLAIGQSMDIQENCKAFLRSLMFHKQLTFAAYWIQEKGYEKNNGLQLIYAIPDKYSCLTDQLLHQELLAILKQKKIIIINNTHLVFNKLSNFFSIDKGCFLLYRISNQGVLLLHRQVSDFQELEITQLNTVFQKFGFFMEGLLAQDRLIQEMQMREQTEHALKKREKQYKAIFESSYQAIGIYDVETDKVLDCNQQAVELYQFNSKEELLKTSLIDFLAPIQFNNQTREELMEEKFNYLQKHDKFQRIIIAKRKTGEEFVVEETAIKDFDQNKKHLFFFIHNIYEKYKAQKEIAERKSIYQSLIYNSFDGIDIVELLHFRNKQKQTTAKLIVRNEVMKKILGGCMNPIVFEEDILKLSPEKQANGQKSEELLLQIRKQLQDIGYIQHDWQLLDKDGNVMDFEAFTQLIEVNNKVLLIRIFKNVSKRKKQERLIQQQILDLNEKNEELKKYIESNMNLENFAYAASHDLQAPLRTIISYTQLLERRLQKSLGEDEKLFMDFIVSATLNMQQLIKDLLAFSRVNTTKINVQKLNAKNLIEEVILELHTNIQEKKAVIHYQQLPKICYADRIKLKQLFQNLITNSLKFTQTNTIPNIHIYAEEQTTHWLFSIKDNGIGIDKEYQQKIFLLFRRLHNNTEYKGTGIGLALCKKIVEQHSGKIGVESKLNEGSRFYFTIKKGLVNEPSLVGV